MKVSGFSFVHNALTGGLPIIEAVEAIRDYVDDITIVDMQSTDQTPQILRKLGVRVVESPWPWGDNPRDTLHIAFQKHIACGGEVIIFFEADEVYEDRLLQAIRWQIERGQRDIAVWRLQLEANFQRCRWYPVPVHRVFPKGGGSYIEHPTHCPDHAHILPPAAGFLWDISNCFRDNWFGRKHNQSEIFGEPRSLMVPEHFTEPVEISMVEEEVRLGEAYWQWTETPFAIPNVLRPLVGVTNYADSRTCQVLLNG